MNPLVLEASFRTSSATTANPRPASPARAALGVARSGRLRLATDRLGGYHSANVGAFLAAVQPERDLSFLLLAGLSLSTDAYVGDAQRAIDVIRNSLLLFGEALLATGDRFAEHGFSSLRRTEVRMQTLKSFTGSFDAAARGRIGAIRPGYYSRMGAAIRQSIALLEHELCRVRLLLILSDGKANDIDGYHCRYAIEDTRRAGVRPFFVIINREGASYLSHLFGPTGYTVVRQPAYLPARLPLLYAQLTGR